MRISTKDSRLQSVISVTSGNGSFSVPVPDITYTEAMLNAFRSFLGEMDERDLPAPYDTIYDMDNIGANEVTLWYGIDLPAVTIDSDGMLTMEKLYLEEFGKAAMAFEAEYLADE